MVGVCLKYSQHNYGSKLQALATIKMIEKLGINYEIIRFDNNTFSHYIKSIPRLFNTVFLYDRYCEFQRSIEFKRHPEIKKYINVRNQIFDNFDKNYESRFSKVYKGYKKLCVEANNMYDSFITCSDQLWSPAALGSNFYNLMFVSDEKIKVSWSSSFGVKKIPWYQKKKTRVFLNRIQHISVRENQGAKIVYELTGREVPVLMDPVFAFLREEWDVMVPYMLPEYDKYIFCYFLGDNKEHREAVERLAKETNCKIVTLRHLDRFVKHDEEFGDYAPYDVDPMRFLNILRNAYYVCTDSFHGTAFSIIYEKKFIVFNRYDNTSKNSKNSRIDSVCENLNLNNRRYDTIETITDMITADIDYIYVRNRIEEYRKQTMEFLKVLV